MNSIARFLRRRWLVLLGGLLALAVAAYVMQPAAIPVEVSTAEQGLLRVTVDEDGKTRIRERYIVSAPLSGRLGRIVLRPGDEVTIEIEGLASLTNPVVAG